MANENRGCRATTTAFGLNMAPGMIPVRVAIRVRPLSGKERQEGCENALKVVEGRPQVHTYRIHFPSAVTLQSRINHT